MDQNLNFSLKMENKTVFERRHFAMRYPVSDIGLQGQEDCLLLNVYVPETAFDNLDDKLPVMFWIHGGSLTAGSNKYSSSGPKHLVEKNVITVHVNYRLGPLGSMLTVVEFYGVQ